MAKFWRSGMIDKKVIKEREQAEYINRLHRAIFLLRNSEYGMKERPKYNHPDIGDLINGVEQSFKIADDYDEVRVGDNVLLNFNKQFITTRAKTPVKDAIIDSCSYWLRKNAAKRCDADIKYGRKIEEIIKNENNTRALRQEE